jgi:four helix bundle suffix protein
MKKLEKDFLAKGGFTERMYTLRQNARGRDS